MGNDYQSHGPMDRYADTHPNRPKYRCLIHFFGFVDFKNDYKTLYPWYMESIWWVFRQLYAKGLVYQGVKVMPYSTACTTALSNFESGQNYKDVVDPAVVVGFPLIGDKDGASLLAWTTTPWTLPSNLSLCINPEMQYLRIRDVQSGAVYILAESRLEATFKDAAKFEVLEKFAGRQLEGLKYEPLFDYFSEYAQKMNAHRVLCDGYVTEDSGTGVVHQAPYFGEDDYRVCLANGVIARDSEIVCPVDDTGRFVEPVHDFVGQFVKDADKNIIALLKVKGRLVQAGQVKHSYPYCWRSDTPLIYKAVPSWFIRVEQMSAQLLQCSSQTYWVPDFVKEKRFGNWLRDARDWAVSRNRYWGTPIPIWVSADGEEVVCIGSIAELQQYTSTPIKDLHRESIDDIVIPSKRPGQPPLRRIPQVFDCWFESGSMPFAQQHYPFENQQTFESSFPADFIAEGIDQTRGWFYTLLVISTALFNKPPFKNLIANGLVLASDGQKMSKRKKNYPDPLEVVHKYGADALRLYLINSPVVRAENLRFKEEGVRDIIKDVFLPWFNAYRFLFQNIYRYVKEEPTSNGKFQYNPDTVAKTTNIMDVWILSFKESLLDFVSREMKAYRLYTVVPRLTRFIDQLTNWYVRLNRRRIKGELGIEECASSLNTLFDVLDSMVKMMAPFTPYLSEYMYQRLSRLSVTTNAPAPKAKEAGGAKKKPATDISNLGGSVHLQMMPKPNRAFIRTNIELAVSRMQSVIELGRVMRDRKTMPIKYPVPEVIVIQKDQQYLDDIKSLDTFILGELNARKLTVCADKLKYGVQMRAEPDHKTLGLRLKADFKAVMAAIKQLSDAEISAALKQGYYTIVGNRVELEEVRVIYTMSDTTSSKYEAHSDNEALVLMDFTPTDDLLHEGVAREIINRVQKLKKKAQLIPTDSVVVYFHVTDAASDVRKVASSHQKFIETTIKSPFLPHNEAAIAADKTKPYTVEEVCDIKGVALKLTIRMEKQPPAATNDASVSVAQENLPPPTLHWVNVVSKVAPRYTPGTVDAASPAIGTVLLEDENNKVLTLAQLHDEIVQLFGLYQLKLHFGTNGKVLDLTSTKAADSLNGATVVVSLKAGDFAVDKRLSLKKPAVRYANLAAAKKSTVLLENPKGVVLQNKN